MSLISEELEQIKSAPGAFNKTLLLIVTGRLSALGAMFVCCVSVLLLGAALFYFPAQSGTIIEWLGIIGTSMGIGSQGTSLGHSLLNKLKGPDHIHVGPSNSEQIVQVHP